MRNFGTTGDLEGVVRPNGQEKAYKTGRAKAKPWLTVVKQRQRNWLKCEKAKAKPWLTEKDRGWGNPYGGVERKPKEGEVLMTEEARQGENAHNRERL